MNGFRSWICRARTGWFLTSLGLALSVPAVAWGAAKNDEKARQKGNEAIDSHYLAMNMKQAESGLKEALKLCEKGGCSPEVEATLRRDLATVYIAGMKKKGPGKEQMVKALELDPNLKLNPDLKTDEVQAVFEAAGGKQAEPEPEPEADAGNVALSEDTASDTSETEAEPDESAGAARVHWLSLQLQLEFLRHTQTLEACTSGSSYFCYADDDTRYGTQPGDEALSPVAGNTVQGGFARATTRVLLGYDYLLLDNLTLGARVGFAFGGAPVAAGEQAFQAFHLEARAQYLLSTKPLTGDGFDPYVAVQGGSAQVDSGVPIDVWLVSDPPPTGQRYELRGYRKTGKGFLGAALGTYYSISPSVAPFLELAYMQMLGVSGQVVALRLGLAYGI